MYLLLMTPSPRDDILVQHHRLHQSQSPDKSTNTRRSQALGEPFDYPARDPFHLSSPSLGPESHCRSNFYSETPLRRVLDSVRLAA